MSDSRAYADRTIAAYRVHAAKAERNWSRIRVPSRFLRQFAAALRPPAASFREAKRRGPRASAQPPGGRVLDYGCGIGVEMVWLRKQGFLVDGVEGALEFVLAARKRCPGAEVLHARFESIPLAAGHYDGIWCNAALIHVPPQELSRQLEKLSRVLKPGGLLGLTLAWGRAKGFIRRDWISGRYIAAYSRREAATLFRGWGVQMLKVTARDGRQGRWIQILASCHNRKQTEE